MKKRSVKHRLVKGGAVVTALAALYAWSFTMQTVHYTVTADKLTEPVRIVFISDLHSCRYGKGQSSIMKAIDDEKPDAVLFGGDLIDHMGDLKDACDLLKQVKEKYPCAYTPGNHELMRNDLSRVYSMVSDEAGVPILLGNSIDLGVKDQDIRVYGIIDAWEYGDHGTQLDNCRDSLDRDRYNILLAHQPEQIDEYLSDGGDFDLVLSGHAHGGQWRIPGILEQGLFAPDQGLFPKRTSGVFYEGSTVQVVSRGLSRPVRMAVIPRFFNRPELSVIDLVPADEK